MRLQAMTDDAVASAIGARLQELRLKKNISQEQVAKEAGISRQTLVNLLRGKGTIVNLIAVLRAIGELERMSSLVQDVLPSPLQVIKMAGNKRIRASGTRATGNKDSSSMISAPNGKNRKDSQW